MPGYVIHLAEATVALRHLKRKICNAINEHPFTHEWEQKFLYGALLPDSVGGTDKKISHFWNEDDNGKVLIGPDLNKFKEKYENELKNYKDHPLLFGYYNHLYTDLDFFTKFIPSKVAFLDNEMQITDQLQEIRTAKIKKNDILVTLEGMFSEQYLYGDYTLLNKRLIDRYELVIPSYTEISFTEIPEISTGDMKKVISKLELFIAESETMEGALNVFVEGDIEAYIEELSQKIISEYE